MHNKATRLIAPATGCRKLRAPVVLVLMALAGCFGPPTMHYDIQEYNKQVVSSEQQMLLYNIGRLNRNQPPHFMMLSSVSQTRMFSAGLSFQWTQLWNSLVTPSLAKPGTTKDSGTFQAGPFTAGTVENPTITFVPIQGQDFAQRFETPLTDKLTLFLEDREWYATDAEKEAIVLLFAQSLSLSHGDDDKCKKDKSGFYVNRFSDPQDSHLEQTHYYVGMSDCVKEIVQSYSDFVQIDANHKVPTEASDEPKAADLVTALQANYKWAKDGDKFALTNPVKIPAWLDYSPEFTAPSRSKKPDSSAPIFWVQKKPPWQGLQYTLPKGYAWKAYNVKGGKTLFVLTPDGYDLERDGNGDLRLKNGNPVLVEVKGKEPKEDVRFSYGDKVVKEVWPVPQNYFYFELRKNESGKDPSTIVTDAIAERDCFSDLELDPANGLVCGFFKIGNLLQILQRLAGLACTPKAKSDNACGPSIFGIGSKEDIPSWADSSAPFTYQADEGHEEKKWVWVPAHDPVNEAQLAERDRKTFFTLYKLYQMSLVDTSKLVAGAPPVTISK
jgi:hypothetical protein